MYSPYERHLSATFSSVVRVLCPAPDRNVGIRENIVPLARLEASNLGAQQIFELGQSFSRGHSFRNNRKCFFVIVKKVRVTVAQHSLVKVPLQVRVNLVRSEFDSFIGKLQVISLSQFGHPAINRIGNDDQGERQH